MRKANRSTPSLKGQTMDPAACIAHYLTLPRTYTLVRGSLVQDIRAWYARGGFHPMVEDIKTILDRRGKSLPNGWADDARTLGAR
jgi:hypothetical protein